MEDKEAEIKQLQEIRRQAEMQTKKFQINNVNLKQSLGMLKEEKSSMKLENAVLKKRQQALDDKVGNFILE